MQWHNMSRIETLDRFHETHFNWNMDALELELVKPKKDQAGTGAGRKRKLYVNVNDPAVCGVLPIAVWALIKESPAELASGEKFLDGKYQRGRYRKLLSQIYEIIGDDAEIEFELHFGANVNELGTHSHRKGSVSFLLAIIDGLNPVAVYIRANWSLGNTQDRYVMGGPGEDELCGRLLAFLDMRKESFATLPPHFDAHGLQRLREIGYDNLVTGYSQYSSGYRSCIRLGIAPITGFERVVAIISSSMGCQIIPGSK